VRIAAAPECRLAYGIRRAPTEISDEGSSGASSRINTEDLSSVLRVSQPSFNARRPPCFGFKVAVMQPAWRSPLQCEAVLVRAL
jgi:hypothetical protein